MSEEIEKFVLPELKSFGGYAASKAPETLKGKIAVPVEKIIKLDANENPYGARWKVRKAIAGCRDTYIPTRGNRNSENIFRNIRECPWSTSSPVPAATSLSTC